MHTESFALADSASAGDEAVFILICKISQPQTPVGNIL